jgi:hypothetical protein
MGLDKAFGQKQYRHRRAEPTKRAQESEGALERAVRERLDALRWYDLLQAAQRRGPETMVWLTRALLEQLDRGGHLVATCRPDGSGAIGRDSPTRRLCVSISDDQKLQVQVQRS